MKIEKTTRCIYLHWPDRFAIVHHEKSIRGIPANAEWYELIPPDKLGFELTASDKVEPGRLYINQYATAILAKVSEIYIGRYGVDAGTPRTKERGYSVQHLRFRFGKNRGCRETAIDLYSIPDLMSGDYLYQPGPDFALSWDVIRDKYSFCGHTLVVPRECRSGVECAGS